VKEEMPLIERYILRRIAVTFIVTLGTLVGTLWILEILKDLDLVTAKGQAIWILFLITLLGLPVLVQTIAPIAFVIATIFSLSNLNGDSELAAISAAGASRKAVYRPVLALAALIMIAVALSHHVIGPASLAALRGIITRVRADVIATVVQEGSFRSIEDALTMHIREKAADGSFRGIFVSDDRNPQEPVQYTAAEGVLLDRAGTSYFILQNGDMIRENRLSGASNVIRFETYALDLSQFTAPGVSGDYRPRERSTLALLNRQEAAPGEETDAGADREVASVLHNRITSPLYVMVFALIALGYTGNARTSRQDRSIAILYAAIVCTGLRTAGYTAAGAAAATEAAIPFLYAIPAVGILLGLWLAYRQRPMRTSRTVGRLFDGLGEFAARVVRRAGMMQGAGAP
jgi:lipopolysaccharide export system permease protein